MTNDKAPRLIGRKESASYCSISELTTQALSEGRVLRIA
jgi:hypothetical protein